MSHWTDSSRGVYPDKDRHFQELSPREFLIWEFKEVDGERLIYGVLEGFLFETFENAEAALSKMVLMEDDPNEGYDEEFSHDEEAWREIKNLEIAASAF
jgi:hypothetical protein